MAPLDRITTWHAPERRKQPIPGGDLFHLISRNLPDYCIFVLSPQGIVLSWSPGAERMTEYSAREVVGNNLAFLDLPEGAPGSSSLRVARETGRFEHEDWWTRRDGVRFWVDQTISPLRDDDGTLVGYIGIVRDLTERAKARAAASAKSLQDQRGADRESDADAAERRAAFLAEASSVLVASAISFDNAIKSLARLAVSRLADWCVVYSLDDGGSVHLVEVAHRDPREEAAMQDALDLRIQLQRSNPIMAVINSGHAEMFEEVKAEQLEVLAHGKQHLDLLRKLGVASLMITPLIARGRVHGALMLVRSAPDQRYNQSDLELSEELARRAAIAIDNARLYRAAQEANRAKADFLAIVSHELRTPLNAIMGYSDLLDTGISGPISEPQRRQLARIRGAARHLLQLIEEILSYARIEAGGLELDLEKTTLGQIAEDAAAVIEPMATGKNLALRLKLDCPKQQVTTDAAKVRQILVNLLSNAVKFTQRGEVEIGCTVDDTSARFWVRDTGSGISREQIEKIFEAFWQVERPTTRHVGGTGLGLSVARRFARLLGGEIRVASEPGRGSTFTFTLPLHHAASKTEG